MHHIKILLLAALLFLSSSLSFSQYAISDSTQTEVRMLINLMDYIAKDYQMAVEDGEVINDFEYAEMTEFSGNALEIFNRLKKDSSIDFEPIIEQEVERLQSLISEKAWPAEVSETANFIRDEIVELRLVPLAPAAWPNLKKGQALFAQQCASCHGADGKGNGPASAGLNPMPTNFHDREVINKIAPLQAFNTISLGIEGTSMRAFEELSPEEVWNLSFYILSLPHKGEKHRSQQAIAKIGLEEIATLSNEKLQKRYPDINIGSIRTAPPEVDNDYLSVAQNLLDQSLKAYNEGDLKHASNLALKAYLQGVEPVEPHIKASDNKLFQDLEASMMGIRASMKDGEKGAVLTAYELATSKIEASKTLLGSTDRSMMMTATIALTILLREGLEAFLIILAILGILQSMGAARAIKWVHSGWIIAVVMGIAGWFFADALMTWDAQTRELMEGVIALVAVLVLLYLGFWMHGKTNATKWKAFVETRVKTLINNNNMIGLASFSFIVVFREAFESVLFLSALTADNSSESSMGVFIGTIISAVLLFFIAWSMLKWFKKMPIHKVFFYASIIMLALAFILAGEGVHALQEGGYIEINSFPINIRFSIIGLYPTYETIFTQLAIFALIVGLWKWSSRKSLATSP
ncbi:MAG: FTR1 family protein [Salibacteraceae bacterium]